MVRFTQLHNTIPYHLHKNLIIINLKLLRTFFKSRPVPLVYWIKFSSLVNYLFPSLKHISPHPTLLESPGESVDVPDLKNILKGEILGSWALDKVTIEFLWRKILSDIPNTIIECGSGISTLILAQYAYEFNRRNSYLPTIISLEQNSDTKESTQDRLKYVGLKDVVKVIHNPINDNGDYIGDKSDIKNILGGNKIDLILIDGPSGPPGCRVSTINYLLAFCKKNTEWFLDDSFRNGELWALDQWQRTPGIQVKGIYPFGKGLGAGRIEDPTKVVDNLLTYKPKL